MPQHTFTFRILEVLEDESENAVDVLGLLRDRATGVVAVNVAYFNI